MVNETKSLKVQGRDGTITECVIVLSGGPPWTLRFSGIALKREEFTREDLFESLCALREELEKIGAQALCAGARPEVFPSGMARSMGGGRKAYVTRLGVPTLRSDLIDIFDYAEPQTVGSVVQQRVFHDKWVESLRQ